MIWRFDRFVFSSVTPVERHRTQFAHLVQALEGNTRHVVVSIMDEYAKPRGRIAELEKQDWRLEPIGQLIDHNHRLVCPIWLIMIMTGSVEGSLCESIQQMALNAKMHGGDVYRLDKAGLSGMPLPENVLEFSMTIHSKRHTYRRIAFSAARGCLTVRQKGNVSVIQRRGSDHEAA